MAKNLVRNDQSDLVSIVIVNYNGKKFLKKCLDSLYDQTYKNFEIIFVDNNSTDGSVDFIRKNYPEIKVIENKKNYGFANGVNIGIDNAVGKYILLLNCDTWVEKDFLSKLYSIYLSGNYDVIGPLEGHYDGFKGKKYILKIDPFGHPIYIYGDTKDPFYLSGVALFFSKEIYFKTGGLDNDFFMYFEETDWFWRLHLFNKKIKQLDDLWVYHFGSGSSSDKHKIIKKKSFLWRNCNQLQMLLKNYSCYNLTWVIPIYFFQNIFEILFFLLILKPQISFTYVQGWWFNIVNIKKILKKRKEIQKKRKVSDLNIIKKMYLGFAKPLHLYFILREYIKREFLA